LRPNPFARAAGIRFLRGVETECIADGRFHHILAYGADFSDLDFSALLADNRKKLDDMSVELVEGWRRNTPDSRSRTMTPMSATLRLAVGRGWSTSTGAV
jgi:hypothetical protein